MIYGGKPSYDSVPSPTMQGSDLSRVLPRQTSSGSYRGTQTVGYGSTKIDGTNNTITIAAPDGSIVGMGLIPDGSGQYGNFLINKNGKITQKTVNGVTIWFDSTGLSRIYTGPHPIDGRMGNWITKSGVDVVKELST